MYKCNKCEREFKKTSAYINHRHKCKLSKKLIMYIRYDYVKKFLSMREIKAKYGISLTLCDYILKDCLRDKTVSNKLTIIKEKYKGIKRTHSEDTKFKISLKVQKYHKENTEKGKRRKEKEKNSKEKKEFGSTISYIESTIQRRKVDRPSYDVLIEKRKTHSLKSLGELYGVSATTIRNWILWYKKHENYK